MPLHVEIVTPVRVAFTGEADEVAAAGWEGEFGALPGHAAMLTLGRPGVVTLQGASGTLDLKGSPQKVAGAQRFLVGAGFAEVGPDTVTLVVDLCEDVATIDKDKAAAQLREAEGVLMRESPDSVAGQSAQKLAELSRARLNA